METNPYVIVFWPLTCIIANNKWTVLIFFCHLSKILKFRRLFIFLFFCSTDLLKENVWVVWRRDTLIALNSLPFFWGWIDTLIDCSISSSKIGAGVVERLGWCFQLEERNIEQIIFYYIVSYRKCTSFAILNKIGNIKPECYVGRH